jgi:HD-like signal output (HDOD) protein
MMRVAPHDPNHGNPERRPTDADSEDMGLEPEAVAQRLREGFAAPGYKPLMLPSVALELVQLTSDVNVPISKVRSLVQSEPLLAAQLLGAAQSAYYSRGNPIVSLDDAIGRLGLQVIGDLFLQVSLSARLFRAPGYEEPMNGLRVHSVVCANVARLICRRTGFPDDYAFMCGLLHDVGMAAGIVLIADVPRGREPPPYYLIQKPVELVHEEAARMLGRSWSLPDDVQLVLEHHHHFEIEGRVHPLAAAICLADAIAARVGANAGGEVDEATAAKAAGALGLSLTDVEGLALAGENFLSIA